jgi:hypothetical protein
MQKLLCNQSLVGDHVIIIPDGDISPLLQLFNAIPNVILRW